MSANLTNRKTSKVVTILTKEPVPGDLKQWTDRELLFLDAFLAKEYEGEDPPQFYRPIGLRSVVLIDLEISDEKRLFKRLTFRFGHESFKVTKEKREDNLWIFKEAPLVSQFSVL